MVGPIDQFGKPFFKVLAPTDYTSLQKSFVPGMPQGLRWCIRAHYLPRLSDKKIHIITRFTAPLPGKSTMVYLESVRGATGRLGPAVTEFPDRNAGYSVHIFPGWTDPVEDRENITSDITPSAPLSPCENFKSCKKNRYGPAVGTNLPITEQGIFVCFFRSADLVLVINSVILPLVF